ncbi:MAG: nucleotidyltransferase domain-containing protein [Cyanobium sp.]
MNLTPPASAPIAIAGIPAQAQQRLLEHLATQPQLQVVWLFGSRAMGRHQPGSDIDLCLEGPRLSHSDRLLLPWRLDLVLRHELPSDLDAHVQRVGRCVWRRP